MDWISIIKLVVICYVLSDLAQFIGEIVVELNPIKNRLLGVIQMLLGYILTCERCFSFWFVLIMTSDLFVAALIGLTIGLLKKIKWKI